MTVHDIEMMGIGAIEEMCVRAGYLTPYLNLNDKEPSWDGKIFIYNNEKKTKKDFAGKVDVQVKGTYQEDQSLDNIKYYVDVSDLRAYLKAGGAIYFVVYISAELQKKIYYKTLPPVKLIQILKTCDKQDTKRLDFSTLPSDKNKVTNIFLNLYNNNKMQHSFSEDTMISVDELENSKEITGITGSVLGVGYDGKDNGAPLFDNEVYLYAQKNNVKVSIPILMTPTDFLIGMDVNATVTANGLKFYDKICSTRSKNGVEIKIGKSVSFPLIKAPQVGQVNFNLCSNLNDQVVDLEFLINAIKAKGYEINGIRMDLSTTQEQLEIFNIARAEKKLELLKKIKAVFTKLHIKKDLDLAKLTVEDWRRINVLIAAFYEDKVIPNWQIDIPPVAFFNIHDIHILLAFEKVKDQQDTYKLYDLFNSNLVIAYGDPEADEKYFVTLYTALTADDYCRVDNIDYSDIVPAYKKALEMNPDITHAANDNMLKLLTAFDKTHNSQQLKAAEDLCEWIIEVEGSNENEISILNKLQIVKRKRKLTEDEMLALVGIIENKNASEEVKFAAYLLMDNLVAAKAHFSNIPIDRQENLKQMPIYTKFCPKK